MVGSEPIHEAPAATGQNDVLLSLQELRKFFPVKRGVFSRTIGHVRAVDGVSFDVARGQTLGLVGESGCGKTTTARVILRLEDADGGSVWFNGDDILSYEGARLRALRREIQAIFQDPYSSLNPRKTVWDIVSEPVRVHRVCPPNEMRDRVIQTLEKVGLRADHMRRYPHEFSGGQRQRIGIARALSVSPQLIVCDEPVSALDVSIRSQILNILIELQRELGLAFIFIAHDLSVVEHISDTVAVMYLGKVVEMAPADEFYRRPLHPYSEALLSATPVPNPEAKSRRIILSGDVPSPIAPPSGCHFRTRCPLADERCAREEPRLKRSGPTHLVACHYRGSAWQQPAPPSAPISGRCRRRRGESRRCAPVRTRSSRR